MLHFLESVLHVHAYSCILHFSSLTLCVCVWRWQILVWVRWVKQLWTGIWPGSTSPPPAALISTWLQRFGVAWATLPRLTSSLWGCCSGPSWKESLSWKKDWCRSSLVGIWIDCWVSPQSSRRGLKGWMWGQTGWWHITESSLIKGAETY